MALLQISAIFQKDKDKIVFLSPENDRIEDDNHTDKEAKEDNPEDNHTESEDIPVTNEEIIQSPEKVKLFGCEMCPVTSKYCNSLVRHGAVHMPEKKVKCNKCGASSKSKFGDEFTLER